MSAKAIEMRVDFDLRTPKKQAEIVRRTKQYLNKIINQLKNGAFKSVLIH
jgi:hypothetical protein